MVESLFFQNRRSKALPGLRIEDTNRNSLIAGTKQSEHELLDKHPIGQSINPWIEKAIKELLSNKVIPCPDKYIFSIGTTLTR